MDLARWWQERRWLALLDLIEQMPRTARWRAAMANDPEAAEAALAAERADGEPDQEWAPALTEWDLGSELLAGVHDRLGDMLRLLVAIKTGVPMIQVERLRTPPKVQTKPFPRPRTAIDEARERLQRRAAEQVLAWFFPHASQN